MQKLLQKFMSSDESTRALQLSGMIRFACVFLQGVVLVKMGVPHALIGLIELMFFLSEFSRYFVLNGTKIAAFAWSDNEKSSIKTRFYTVYLYAIVSILVLLVAYTFYSDDGGFGWVRLSLLAVFTFFTITAEQYDWIFIEKKKSSLLIPYSTIIYGIQAITVCLAIYYGSVDLMLALMSAILILRTIHVHWFIRGEKYLREGMKVFAVVATPIILHSFVTGIMPFIDLWVVEYHFDESVFLYFRYGARQFPIFLILLTGLRQGLMAKLKQKSISEKSAEIQLEIKKHLHLIFIPAIILMLTSPILYQVAYDENFVISAFIFNTYMLILIFHIVIIQVFYYLENNEWILLRFSILEAIINLGLSIWFAIEFGLYGIVWGSVIANFVIKALSYLWLKKRHGVQLKKVLPLRLYGLYSALLIASFAIAYVIYS